MQREISRRANARAIIKWDDADDGLRDEIH